MKRIFTAICIGLLQFIIVGAQEHESEMVMFTPDFRFNDGIFLDFEQVKANSPISKAKILTSADYNARDFFKQIMANDKFYFYDAMGLRKEVDKGDIWGYSRNGILYVQVQKEFHRITYVGNLCHFVADITTYDRRYYGSPYGYNNPYYYPGSYSSYSNPYYSPYYSPYYMPYSPTSVSKKELVQYIIEFETGNTIEYDVKNVELLLSKDLELYQEFIVLRRKQKKQMMFLFLRKYNEKYPLYLPKSK